METPWALSMDFAGELARRALPALQREVVRTLQLNITKRCNLACHHCHVESGPKRTETMERGGIERIVDLLKANASVDTLDLTGGAPELHPDFRYLVSQARALGRRVIDRCNLTILLEPDQLDTATFLAREGVDIVASLPCYSKQNVEQQRGRGVFDGSIEALRELNRLGYGLADSELRLDLVYNPLRASLPPDQHTLEDEYRQELRELFGIEFHHLLTIANMPIKRFAHQLERDGEHARYMSLLVNHFNADTLPALMCKSLVSVAFDGRLYDCDFNQALGIPLATPDPRPTIWDVEDFSALDGNPITTAAHCFACTAGAGSSCGGSLA